VFTACVTVQREVPTALPESGLLNVEMESHSNLSLS
jgi:hypothetical protein